MNIELVVFDMAGTTVNDDDGVNRCVRAALDNVGLTVTRDAVNRVMGIPKPEALRQLIERYERPELAPRLDAIHDDFVARMIRFYQTDPSVHEIPGC
jgi:beta-phosphoglucomutase-like phosphatase (HAD superfamily)